jgi:prepilin-type N-terminal cleavage/methylation domain-containing protein
MNSFLKNRQLYPCQHETRISNRGVTMIELVISVSIIAILAMVLYPILPSGMRAWTSIDENSTFTSEANTLWLYLRPLLAHDGAITAVNSSSLAFTASGNSYLISTVPDGNTDRLVLTRNAGTPQTLATSLTPGTGFTVTYYSIAGDVTSTPNQVRSIDLRLSLQGSNIHTFQSWVLVESHQILVGP